MASGAACDAGRLTLPTGLSQHKSTVLVVEQLAKIALVRRVNGNILARKDLPGHPFEFVPGGHIGSDGIDFARPGVCKVALYLYDLEDR